MTEQLVSFDTAKLAKEKGFNIPCKKRYLSDQYEVYSLANNRGLQIIGIQAPTQSALQKWLRENHNKHPTIHRVTENNIIVGYTYSGTPWKTEKTYEEVLEKWLKTQLKSIK